VFSELPVIVDLVGPLVFQEMSLIVADIVELFITARTVCFTPFLIDCTII